MNGTTHRTIDRLSRHRLNFSVLADCGSGLVTD